MLAVRGHSDAARPTADLESVDHGETVGIDDADRVVTLVGNVGFEGLRRSRAKDISCKRQAGDESPARRTRNIAIDV